MSINNLSYDEFFILTILSRLPNSLWLSKTYAALSQNWNTPGCLFVSVAVVVLVHGTGHGGWCWRFIVPLLRAAGYDVYTPTLTGRSASSRLLDELNRISLDTHVKDITNMLFYEDLSEVVLVGHSYGGMVITESQPRIHIDWLNWSTSMLTYLSKGKMRSPSGHPIRRKSIALILLQA